MVKRNIHSITLVNETFLSKLSTDEALLGFLVAALTPFAQQIYPDYCLY